MSLLSFDNELTEDMTAEIIHVIYILPLWANPTDDKAMIVFLFFFQKTGFDISYTLSP